MAETARANDGKFSKRSASETASLNGVDPAIAGIKPPADAGIDQATIDPTAIDRERDAAQNGSGPGDAKRGRGRPAGSGKKEEKQAGAAQPAKLDLDSINFTLFYAHEILAKITSTPEFALDEYEAKKLAGAALNVMQHYNIKTSQKAIDWGNLLLTGGLIYGAKYHAANTRILAEKKAHKESREAGLQPFNLNAG